MCGRIPRGPFHLLSDATPEGWASLMVVTSLMGGAILVTLAFIGEYLWRTLDEVRGRPLFLVADHDQVAATGGETRPDEGS